MSKAISSLDKYPEYQVDIGIEIHVQLTTKSKIFCCSANDISRQENQNIDPICVGYPGVLPMLNREVINYAIMTGLATNCVINKETEFSRKHYFYPDLPKGYQISQDDKPICSNGLITIKLENGGKKKIRIRRIHMEEDAGKSIHLKNLDKSYVDFNRAGVPLLEIVTEPDIKSSYEAKKYLKAVHSIVTYLGVCTGNMEEGAFRADANISVRKKDATELGTRCELKNINSFKFIGDAIEYEIERQIKRVEQGEKVLQETRLWNSATKKTAPMRSKETAKDYRYFDDPDLPTLNIDNTWIERIKRKIPELPDIKFKRLKNEYDLTEDETEILINDRNIANYYENCAKIKRSKLLINWILRDIVAFTKEHKIRFSELKVTPERLIELIDLIEDGTINTRAAKEIFTMVALSGDSPSKIVKTMELEQINDQELLEKIIASIISANPKQVAAYRSGKTKLIGFFSGQAMQKTKGRGNPKIIQQLLKKLLK